MTSVYLSLLHDSLAMIAVMTIAALLAGKSVLFTFPVLSPFQAHVAFVLNHILPRHSCWPYKSGSQRWRITAAAINVLHAALSVNPHHHSGAALRKPPMLTHLFHR